MPGSGRPRRACVQCNSHKVRCSGDRPNCHRCSRLKRACTYPAETSHQEITSPAALSTSSSHDAASSGCEINIASSQNRVQVVVLNNPNSPQSLSLEKSYVGIPARLVTALVDIYFSHVYNASLLLCKPQFLQALEAGTARPHVVLSVCAFATNFYADASDQTLLREHGFGNEWATRAGKLALQEVEVPHEDNIVSFLNLALYWYSQGAWQRSYILRGPGIQTAHILGLGIEKKGREDLFETERSRRLFWACYLINSFASETPFACGPTEYFRNLTLPICDEDYDAGIVRNRQSFTSTRSVGSTFGELVKIMTIWSTVHDLIRSPESNMASRLTALQGLDARLNNFWSTLPDNFKLTPLNLGSVSVLPRILLINIVYHQSLCALHSSIVPLFSWGECDQNWLHARQVSAQIAFEHANIASRLFEAALNHLSDPGVIPSFVGYAAYCACAIQIPFLWCPKQEIQQSCLESVRVNVKMIQTVGKYWKFTSLLGANVRHLYEMHSQNPCHIEDEPKNTSPDQLRGFRVTAKRARASILGHNEILWGADGKFAGQGDANADVSSDARPPQPPPPASPRPEPTATDAQPTQMPTTWGNGGIHPATQLYEAQNLDYFQPFLDPMSINADFALTNNNQVAVPGMVSAPQMASFDLWLGPEFTM